MSTLLLAGRKPAFTYAKTLNTFFKRHHLRVFGDVGRSSDSSCGRRHPRTLRTDKRIGVIILNACEDALRADFDVAVNAAYQAAGGAGTVFQHGMRNLFLTIRQDFWRGNIFYQS